jgi:hypothetical protein
MLPDPAALQSMETVDLIRSIENSQFLIRKETLLLSIIRDYMANPNKIEELRGAIAKSYQELEIRINELKRRNLK